MLNIAYTKTRAGNAIYSPENTVYNIIIVFVE